MLTLCFKLLFSLSTSFFGCSWSCTIIHSSFSVWCFLRFCHFGEYVFTAILHMYLQRMVAKYLFSMQIDSSHIITHTWMVVQAEEASLAKLCRKLVVIILL